MTRIQLENERVNISGPVCNTRNFRSALKINIQTATESFVEFDLLGIDASYANALRRIMLAEVPTMAIEDVFIMRNTSIIPDEVLSHRLGLVPIRADPRCFQEKNRDDEATDLNTLVFRLQIKCEKNPSASEIATLPTDKYINSVVYASQLEWIPQGSQAETFTEKISALYPDIVVAKLRPGQEIDLEMHCIKGVGKDHAKWSPVCTATYRLMPDIRILKEIEGKDAEKFAKCFPPGVIEVIGGKATVIDARKDSMSRECLRHEEFADKVALERIRDHFIFSIESVGQIDARELVIEACKVLIEKCERVKEGLLEITE